MRQGGNEGSKSRRGRSKACGGGEIIVGCDVDVPGGQSSGARVLVLDVKLAQALHLENASRRAPTLFNFFFLTVEP